MAIFSTFGMTGAEQSATVTAICPRTKHWLGMASCRRPYLTADGRNT